MLVCGVLPDQTVLHNIHYSPWLQQDLDEDHAGFKRFTRKHYVFILIRLELTSTAEVTVWLTLYFIIDFQYNHLGRWQFMAVLWTLLKLPPSFSHLSPTQRNMHNTKMFVKLWPGAGSLLYTTWIHTTLILNNLFLVKLVIIQVVIEAS